MKKKNRRLENVKYEFKHNKLAIFAAIYLIAIILVSVFVVFSSVDPDALDVAHKLQSPSSAHWFGTDELGRDYFIRVLYGGRVSLVVGVLAMLTSIVIGVTVGMVAGYFGGIVDNILMRIVDVFSSIPWIIMVTVVGLLFKKGLASIIIVIGLFSCTCYRLFCILDSLFFLLFFILSSLFFLPFCILNSLFGFLFCYIFSRFFLFQWFSACCTES